MIMNTLLSLLLLVQLGAPPPPERPGQPDVSLVEVLDAEVRVHAIRPRGEPDRRRPAPPPGPISSDDIPGRGGGSSRRDGKPSIASRSSELHEVDGRGRRPPAAGGQSPGFRYEYRLRVKNVGPKKVTSLLWEYHAIDPEGTSAAPRRRILCAEEVKPGESKRLRVWTPLAPVTVVSADAAGDSPPKVVVNRVEYADGSAWQRAGWEQGEPKDGRPDDPGRRLRSGGCVVW